MVKVGVRLPSPQLHSLHNNLIYVSDDHINLLTQPTRHQSFPHLGLVPIHHYSRCMTLYYPCISSTHSLIHSILIHTSFFFSALSFVHSPISAPLVLPFDLVLFVSRIIDTTRTHFISFDLFRPSQHHHYHRIVICICVDTHGKEVGKFMVRPASVCTISLTLVQPRWHIPLSHHRLVTSHFVFRYHLICSSHTRYSLQLLSHYQLFISVGSSRSYRYRSICVVEL